MSELHDILAERRSRYGAFPDHARIAQELKGVVSDGIASNGYSFESDQREALDMICHKVARIVNGDPDYADSWRDIAGYATLVANRLDAVTS